MHATISGTIDYLEKDDDACLARIRRLIGAGRSPNEPMAVIVSACTSRQRVLETTLACCADDVQTAGLEPPAVVVMGEVVRLREHLDWLGKLGSQISEQED